MTQAQKFGFDEDFGNDRRGGVSRRAADVDNGAADLKSAAETIAEVRARLAR